MPGNKKPKKKHKPRPLDLSAFDRTIVHAATSQCKLPLNAGQLLDLSLLSHTAMEAIKKGRGTDQDYGTLEMARKLVEVLCDADLGGSKQYAYKAQDAGIAIVSVHGRFELTRKVGFSGLEAVAIGAMLELLDLMLEHEDLTNGLLKAAIVEVERRMHAENTRQGSA